MHPIAEAALATGARSLFYFRPGVEARMLARCQFSLDENGYGGACLTYPIKGMPWRRNIMRAFKMDIDETSLGALFSEVPRIRREHPKECLSHSDCWSDRSEKANAITRDKELGKLCYSIGIYRIRLPPEDQYYLREDSVALLDSELYRVISKLIEPHEKL